MFDPDANSGPESSSIEKLAEPSSHSDETGHASAGDLAIFVKDRMLVKRFREGVTIVGDDHPSILRIGGCGLKRCDHAILHHMKRLWIIELDLERLDQGEPKIQELSLDCPPIHRGGLVYLRGTPEKLKRYQELLRQRSQTEDSFTTSTTNQADLTGLVRENIDITEIVAEGLVSYSQKRKRVSRILHLALKLMLFAACIATSMAVIAGGIWPIIRTVWQTI
ncbi:hypothetical protein [Rubripirellula lacrimiformis]|uniref:hypothetical protein n=1 Tax=Rubripirellula lacrimiformis TaxID=1930273 RepID=UPI00119DD5B8|nr:hypothetical protein [Rubripirellula lacrimiformis]